jgi:hypothetical protein
MDALIFVDTNILLDFYRIRTGGVQPELLSLIEKHKDILITGSQIEMEFKKNRQAVILEALRAQKSPEWGRLTPPAFLANSKPAKSIATAKMSIEQHQNQLKKRIVAILDKPSANDPVFKCLSRVFAHDGRFNLTRSNPDRFAVRRAAKKRFLLGYPPRKQNDTSIGDAINWEWILSCAIASKKGIIIVTRDSDYGCTYDNEPHLNDWLRLEFKERVSQKRRIVLTERLAEAFRLVAVQVSPAAEAEEKKLVEVGRVPRLVRCSECGALLDEEASMPPESRGPCPVCGSMKRLFEVTLSAGVRCVSG